jgi:hypothetical protein
MAMHMFFAVETRWGVPSLMVLYAFAVFLVADRLPTARFRSRLAVILLAVAMAAAALPLSYWVRQQAPQIRAVPPPTRDIAFGPGVTMRIVPGRPFVSGTLRNWTLHQSGVGLDHEAILLAPRAGDFSALLHRVTLERNADYQVEFDARAVAGVTAELSVDLYEGAAYDRAEQNTTFTAIEKTYTHFTTRWNSGPDAPREAMLRFVTVSTTPIQIRNIVFSRLPQR